MTHGKNIPFLGTIHLSALSDIKIPQQVHQGAIMRAKKAIKITLLGLLVFVVIAVLGLLVWSSTSAYPARQVALSALNSSESVTVTQDQWITFTPVSTAEKGLIFYPGGLVEPAAYAPVLHRIAQEGVLVMIVPMPLNLAILNPGAANGVMDHYPSIATWIIAGHSLGGATAAIFADNNPTKIDAIALWDSYPPNSADLSEHEFSALSIFGTMNSVPNTENFNEKRVLLPEETTFVAIEGASHAQFGDYGPQKGDVIPTISLAKQHARVAEIMLDFINP
jgi:hypothetical protein